MKVASRLSTLLCLSALFLVSEVRAQSSDAAQLRRYSQEGEKALNEGRYAEAAQAYEKLRQLAPNTAEVHARLGLIYFQQRKFEHAATALRQAIKLKTTLPNTDLLLAMSLSELGRYRQALPALEKGFKRATDPALKRASGLQLMRTYTGLQQDNQAVEVALELTRLYPKDPEVLYHGSRLFANYAYLATVKIVEVAPDSLWLHLAAGEANESQGQSDAALREYREVLSLDPKRPGVHFRIGRVLLARAQQSTTDTSSEAEALKEFEQELRLDPTNANAAYEAGEIHRKSARFDKALESFLLAVKHYPDFEEALVGVGRTLVSLGRPEQALPSLQKALAVNARNEVSWYQLSLVYKSLGNAAEQQKALVEFQRLRRQKAQAADSETLLRTEVTRQKLDPMPPQLL
jgi:tetratricopeptide (TPR) repeat protein